MSTVLYEVKGNIAILTISREKALNALNSEVLNDLNAALDAVDVNAVRALIITGAGKKSFVAGADIGEMSSIISISSINLAQLTKITLTFVND